MVASLLHKTTALTCPRVTDDDIATLWTQGWYLCLWVLMQLGPQNRTDMPGCTWDQPDVLCSINLEVQHLFGFNCMMESRVKVKPSSSLPKLQCSHHHSTWFGRDTNGGIWVHDGVIADLCQGVSWVSEDLPVGPAHAAASLAASESHVWVLASNGKLFRRDGISQINFIGDFLAYKAFLTTPWKIRQNASE